MAKQGMKDQYAQFMFLSVTQTAANTTTFGRVGVGMAIFEYAALLLERVEYSFSRAALQELDADADVVWGALTGSDSLADLDLDQPQVYDQIELFAHLIGAAANLNEVRQPIVKDFTTLSGGGLLVPAQDMYIAMSSAGMGGPYSLSARVYYRVIPLDVSGYIELAQRLRVLST